MRINLNFNQGVTSHLGWASIVDPFGVTLLEISPVGGEEHTFDVSLV